MHLKGGMMLASQAISYSGAQHKNVNVDLKKVEQANEKKMLFYFRNKSLFCGELNNSH